VGKWTWRYDDADLFWRDIVIATNHPDFDGLSTVDALRVLRTDDTDR